MNAIKIDAENRVIKYVQIGSDYKEIYELLGLECSCFTAPYIFRNDDTIYVDDEGLLSSMSLPGWVFFGEDGTVWKFVGNGLILGGDGNGDNAPVKSSLGDIGARVDFMTPDEVQQYKEELGY